MQTTSTPFHSPFYTLSGPPYDLVPLAPSSPSSPSPSPLRRLRRPASYNGLKSLFTSKSTSKMVNPTQTQSQSAGHPLSRSLTGPTPRSRQRMDRQARSRPQSEIIQPRERRDVWKAVAYDDLHAIEKEWKMAARGLHPHARECLEGAVCLGVTDPCEGLTPDILLSCVLEMKRSEVPPRPPRRRIHSVPLNSHDTPSPTGSGGLPIRKARVSPLPTPKQRILDRPRPPRKAQSEISFNLFTEDNPDTSLAEEQIPSSPTPPSYTSSPSPLYASPNVSSLVNIAETRSRPSCIPRLSLSRPLPPAHNISKKNLPSTPTSLPSKPVRRVQTQPSPSLSPLNPTRSAPFTEPPKTSQIYAYPAFSFIHDAESPTPHIEGWRSILTTSRCSSPSLEDGEKDGICERVRLLNRLGGNLDWTDS